MRRAQAREHTENSILLLHPGEAPAQKGVRLRRTPEAPLQRESSPRPDLEQLSRTKASLIETFPSRTFLPCDWNRSTKRTLELFTMFKNSGRPTVARYFVESRFDPPSIIHALNIGELAHDALCRLSNRGDGPASVFSGYDSNGKLRTDHGHAHTLCETNGAADVITHLTVWAPMGFDEQGRFALRSFEKIQSWDGYHLGLRLEAIGRPEDFTDCVLFGPSRFWRSATPFVSTRPRKTLSDGRPKLDAEGWQVGSEGHDLLRLLRTQPRGSGATIRQLRERRPLHFGRCCLSSLQFRTQRQHGIGTRGNSDGAAFAITLPEERHGPFALGYGAHFGLGLFVPVRQPSVPGGWTGWLDLGPNGD